MGDNYGLSFLKKFIFYFCSYDALQRGLSKLYVCNYGPGGNLVGDSMYKVST